LISFSGESTYSYTYYLLTMAGVLERIIQSKKRIIRQTTPLDAVPLKVLQLQMAKEILAETFGVSVRRGGRDDPDALRGDGVLAGEPVG
jgi:hypothetical protein